MIARRTPRCPCSAVTRRLPLVLAVTALLLPVLSQAADAPPLRVVRVSSDDADSMRKRVAMLEGLCRTAQQLPPAPATPLTDAQINGVHVLEHEELFDGASWAEYVTRRLIVPDAAQGCRPVVYVARSATVERACQSRVRGGTASLDELSNAQQAAPAPEVVEQPVSRSRCEGRARDAEPAAATQAESAGFGTSCVWSGDRARSLLGAGPASATAGGGSSGAAATGFETCLYARLPRYPSPGRQRAVVLKTRSPEPEGQRGNAFQMEARVTANQRLASFSAGEPIAAQRFSRGAVEAFIHQPTKQALEPVR